MSRPLTAARLLIIAALLTGSPAGAAGNATTVLDINGPGGIHLHNRFLVGGLLLYITVMLGALIFLEKRRVAATAILAGGLIVGGLLVARGFG